MWVYGDLNHRGKRTFREYEVDCKTICQFIGKTDKEGTEIYEHDIISVNGKYPKLVKYIDAVSYTHLYSLARCVKVLPYDSRVIHVMIASLLS